MSAQTPSSTHFDFARLTAGAAKSGKSDSAQAVAADEAAAGSASFASSLRVQIAQFQSQKVSFLLGSESSPIDGQASSGSGAGDGANPLAGLGGLTASGRNAGLFDPESGYRMMSQISNREVAYKAQFAELSEMATRLVRMEEHGEQLEHISETTDGNGLKQRLTSFVSEYNDWVQRFDADMAPRGILADTMAAEVSRHELRASIENPFFGAADGLRGMGDLGVSIDPATRLAVFDPTKLDAAVARDRQAAVDTVQEFGANFARSADLLNADDNFIPNRLDNLDRVLDFIEENKASLQAEFGTGDTAMPSGLVAQALAAYNKKFGA